MKFSNGSSLILYAIKTLKQRLIITVTVDIRKTRACYKKPSEHSGTRPLFTSNM